MKNEEQSFWEHLEVLRWHIIRSLAVLVVLAIAAFIFKDFIFDRILLAPKNPSFVVNQWFCKMSTLLQVEGFCGEENNLKIINVNMSGQFMTHIYISLMMALIVGAPYIIWELWRFVKPALKRNEEHYAGGAIVAASLLFYIGVIFSYFIIVPVTINFLGTYQVSREVANMINLHSYISSVMGLSFSVGLVFELPVVVYFLSKIGVVTPKGMKKYRKMMIIAILIVAAVITPPDVFSQIMVAIPLYALYELSIFVSKRASKSVANKAQTSDL